MPIFDDAHRLPASLARLAAQLAAAEKTLGEIELIVVDDASRDSSVQSVNDNLHLFSRSQLIRLPWHCGTGTSVRAGVAAATGRVVAFIDDSQRVDVYRLTTIVRLLNDADILVSPRPVAPPLPHPITHRQNLTKVSRRLRTLAYNEVANRLTTPSFAGGAHRITALRAEVAKTLFSLLQSKDFAFDVETRVVATSMGLRIVALPGAAADATETIDAAARRARTASLHEMFSDLLHARRHRTRALAASASAVDTPADATTAAELPPGADLVIDLTGDAAAAEPHEHQAARRHNRAGA